MALRNLNSDYSHKQIRLPKQCLHFEKINMDNNNKKKNKEKMKPKKRNVYFTKRRSDATDF